ncbi:hypothetical protein M2344_000305 [Sphingobium sp. B8D3C]|nr:hypothetical protein [Sphingobium sp. B8D3B]MCW2417343.1 hypothetical protein [Sphingobium sp. B8D3C]
MTDFKAAAWLCSPVPSRSRLLYPAVAFLGIGAHTSILAIVMVFGNWFGARAAPSSSAAHSRPALTPSRRLLQAIATISSAPLRLCYTLLPHCASWNWYSGFP